MCQPIPVCSPGNPYHFKPGYGKMSGEKFHPPSFIHPGKAIGVQVVTGTVYVQRRNVCLLAPSIDEGVLLCLISHTSVLNLRSKEEPCVV